MIGEDIKKMDGILANGDSFINEFKECWQRIKTGIEEQCKIKDEFCKCPEGGKWALIHEFINCEPLKYCPHCRGKLSSD